MATTVYCSHTLRLQRVHQTFLKEQEKETEKTYLLVGSDKRISLSYFWLAAFATSRRLSKITSSLRDALELLLLLLLFMFCERFARPLFCTLLLWWGKLLCRSNIYKYDEYFSIYRYAR